MISIKLVNCVQKREKGVATQKKSYDPKSLCFPATTHCASKQTFDEASGVVKSATEINFLSITIHDDYNDMRCGRTLGSLILDKIYR